MNAFNVTTLRSPTTAVATPDTVDCADVSDVHDYSHEKAIIDALVRRSRATGTIILEPEFKLTRRMATYLLSIHKSRKLRVERRKLYARQMLNGLWNRYSSFYIIDINGKSIDGQTRLNAFLDTGMEEATIMLVVGVPAEAIKGIDLGGVRNVADIGRTSESALSDELMQDGAIFVRVLHRYIFNKGVSLAINFNTHLSPSEVNAAVEANREYLLDLHSVVTETFGRKSKILSAGLLMFLLHTFSIDLENRKGLIANKTADVEEFLTKLLSGSNLDARDPILLARDMIKDRAHYPKNNSHFLLVDWRLRIVFAAWNKYLSGEMNAFLRMPKYLPSITYSYVDDDAIDLSIVGLKRTADETD